MTLMLMVLWILVSGCVQQEEGQYMEVGISNPPPVGAPSVDDDGDGQSENDGDCNDADAQTYLGAPEWCDGDGIDNDCEGDGQAPGDPNPDDGFWLAYDRDGDGYGDPSRVVQGCGYVAYPPGVVRVNPFSWDCNDNDRTIRPFQAENLDGLDENCDQIITGRRRSFVDERVGLIACFVDRDGDGYGGMGWGNYIGHYQACPPLSSHLAQDCDEGDGRVSPSAREWCDGRDEDCDGRVDNAQGEGMQSFTHAATGFTAEFFQGTCAMQAIGFFPW